MDVKNLLSQFVYMSRGLLGEDLTGVYLHGSAAMGCFNPRKSDLDLILVVERGLPDAVKRAFLEEAVRLDAEAPAKGMEWSIVRREFCRPFVYPTPFELHYSRAHLSWFHRDPQGYVEKMRGVDRDLAAHFTIIHRYGAALYGGAVNDVFGEVPRADYLDSICRDVENAREAIAEDPLYCILNLCRVLACLKEGLVLSKRAGAEWAVHNLPAQWRELVSSALQCYETDSVLTAAPKMAGGFAAYMLSEIESYQGQYGEHTAGREEQQ